MFFTFSFLHTTENLIKCLFQDAGILLFYGLWCFCLTSKCSYFLNIFRNYFHAKAFKIFLTMLFNHFWSCLLKLLVKIIATSVKYFLRCLPYFLIINFFLICVYYVLLVLHVSYLYVCFVNISAYILTVVFFC